MRHSLTILIAMLSMAAGAWQGTRAHSDQPRSSTAYDHARNAPAQLTLRGCMQNGEAPGTVLLIARDPGAMTALGPASAGLQRTEDIGASPAAASPTIGGAEPIAYEVVPGTPELNLPALVGRRVDIQGIPEHTARGATADDSPAAAMAADDSPSVDTPARTSGQRSQRSRVRVTAVRAIGGSCP